MLTKFPREKLIEYRVVPYEETKDYVAFGVADPFRFEELKEFEAYAGKPVIGFLVAPSKMEELLFYIDNKIQQQTVFSDFDKADIAQEGDDVEDLTSIDAPVIKLCDAILRDAVGRISTSNRLRMRSTSDTA